VAREILTNIGVANIYEAGAFRSQIVSQSYLGESLTGLEDAGDWLHVRQEDGYEGWISAGQVVNKPPNWDRSERYATNDLVTFIYDQPDGGSAHFRDLVLGSALPLLERGNGWVKLLLPDGNQGWVPDHPFHYPPRIDLENLLNTAFRLQGVPYYWGGKTPKGVDCSGFIQTIFRLNGKLLPRDAWMQAETGKLLPAEWSSWLPGDLLFFSENGTKVTHVALSLGEGDFIHASGFVKLNSLNPGHPELYYQPLVDNFVKTQRVI